MLKTAVKPCLAAVAGAFLALAANTASAQADRPLRLVVITQAGGAADQAARLVGKQLSEVLGRTVLVENKPGAGGNIASQYVARSKADGDTLLVTSNNHTINPALYKSPGYTTDDLAPVVQIARGPSVVVIHPGVETRSIEALIEAAKKNPVSYGSIGVGSGAHVVAECLKAATGAKLEHIPYKGGAPAVADVVGGHIPVVFTTLASAGAHVRTERIQGLAVSSANRWPSVPEIPTLAEKGLGACTYETWLGIVAPKDTPPDVIARLNKDMSAIIKSDLVRTALAPQGYEPVGESVSHFAAMLAEDKKKTSKLIQEAGITAD